ncbi:MAG: hypothetical protein ACQEXJ_11100 [Myxococcota bacterium]
MSPSAGGRSLATLLGLALTLVACRDEPAEPETADAGASPPPAATERVDAAGGEPPPETARDREPNDDWRHAIAIEPGEEIRGFVDPPEDPAQGDADWYVLKVPGDEPALLRAELRGPDDLDVVLEWMPASDSLKPKPVVRADVNVKTPGPEILGALKVPPGRAYLRVREAWYRGQDRTGSDKPYHLSTRLSPWREGVEAEPNDTAEDAVSLEVGERGSGTLGHMRDRDVWRVPLPADVLGGRARVTVTGVPGVEAEVDLAFEGQSTTLARGRGAEGRGVSFRHLSLPSSGADALLVTVRAREGAAPETAYEILVEPEEAAPDLVEREPNDAAGDATALGRTGRVLGHVDRPGDEDHLEVLLDRAGALHATLEAPAETNLALVLLGPDGDRRAVIDEAGPGEPEILRGYGVAPGRWGLVVRGHDREAHDPEHPWTLTLEVDDAGADETEPNDDREAPRVAPLEPDTPRRGWIHPRGDTDWWRLELGDLLSGRIVTFRVEPPPGVPLDVTVHDDAGGRLTGREGITPPEVTTFTHFLAPGTYHVRVTSPEPDAASPREPYRLTAVD